MLKCGWLMRKKSHCSGLIFDFKITSKFVVNYDKKSFTNTFLVFEYICS